MLRICPSVTISIPKKSVWQKSILLLMAGANALVLLALNGPALSQTTTDSQRPTKEITHPLAPADTSSPRATLRAFLNNITEAYKIYRVAQKAYDDSSNFLPSPAIRDQLAKATHLGSLAAQTLDLSKVAASVLQDVRLESILMLKEILDRIELPPIEAIPDTQLVKTQKLTRWRIPNTEITIAKLREGPRAGEFLFTHETVARIPEFYYRVEFLPYLKTETKGMYEFYISTAGRQLAPKWLGWVDDLPPWAKQLYRGQTVWQWAALVVALVVAFLIPLIVYRLLHHRTKSLPSPQSDWMRLVVPITTLLVLVLVRHVLDEQVNITGQVLFLTLFALNSIGILILVLIAFWGVRAIFGTIIASPRIDPKSLNATVIRVTGNILGGLLGFAILFWGAQRVGVPLVPLLGGLGLGGLAVALAIGPTLENLIGGLTLYFDQSVRVGDFCRYGDKFGTVESIGLRSTRIRAFDRTVTSVPNSKFSNMELTNGTYRDKRLIRTTIGLRYETSAEQLRYVLTKIREMLISHPKVDQKPIPSYARLIGFGQSSLDIDVFAYVATRKLLEFLAIREDVYLRVMYIVGESGTGFAFPSTTTYLARDGGLDKSQTEVAEEQVRVWRDKGELPFPEFGEAQIEKLFNSLDFPPIGSPEASEKSS